MGEKSIPPYTFRKVSVIIQHITWRGGINNLGRESDSNNLGKQLEREKIRVQSDANFSIFPGHNCN
jgi:hypothetical protein